MAAPRLPFLYPSFLRSVRSCEPTTYRSLRASSRRRLAGLHTTRVCCEQNTFHKRYGPAVEPPTQIPPFSGDKPGVPLSQSSAEQVAARDLETDGERGTGAKSSESSQEPPKSDIRQPSQAEDKPPPLSASESPTNIAAELPQSGETRQGADQSDQDSAAAFKPGDAAQHQGKESPIADHLRSIFELPDDSTKPPQSTSSAESSSSDSGPQDAPPPLSPPPYVHHFDTYTLVKSLSNGGFTEEQSVQMMKAIRGLLADNLDVARRALYSKSDFENEAYLFRAACSELRNSLQASRNAEIQAQRSRRAQLQHEADILSQRFNQELSGLSDNLKEMFNNQKISTRELQRTQDTAIQELNYKIMVSLHSDGRSQVEGLRWVLTRRAALTIATCAVMIVAALRYQSYKAHQREQEKKAAEAAQEASAASFKPDDASRA